MNRKSVKDDVDEERRMVRTLESHLAVLRRRGQRKRTWSSSSETPLEGPLLPMAATTRETSHAVGKEQDDESHCRRDCLMRSSPRDNNNTLLPQLMDFLDLIGGGGVHGSNGILSGTNNRIAHGGSNSITFNQDNQSDISALRLMPLISGVYFTKINVVRRPQEEASPYHRDVGTHLNKMHRHNINNCRTYSIQGAVIPSIGALTFVIDITVALSLSGDSSALIDHTHHSDSNDDDDDDDHNDARVTGLSIRFLTAAKEQIPTMCQHPQEELCQLSLMAFQSKNIPQMFRNIVTFAEFDSCRRQVFGQFQKLYPNFCTTNTSHCSATTANHERHRHAVYFHVLNASTFRIILLATTPATTTTASLIDDTSCCEQQTNENFMELQWSWKFNTVGGQGHDELVISNIHFLYHGNNDGKNDREGFSTTKTETETNSEGDSFSDVSSDIVNSDSMLSKQMLQTAKETTRRPNSRCASSHRRHQSTSSFSSSTSYSQGCTADLMHAINDGCLRDLVSVMGGCEAAIATLIKVMSTSP